MMMEDQFKYFAYISFSFKDLKWGKRLHMKLESYRMPATLCNERGWRRHPIYPVFFAPRGIQPANLTKEIQERLIASRNLIVICSPNSAQSEWVAKEIEFFHKLGRTEQIYFFIIDGIPHSGNPNTECYNYIVDKLGIPEILGANIHEKIYRLPYLNRERAFVQLISKLLNVEYDSIWKRHKRRLAGLIISWFSVLLFMLLSIIYVVRENKAVDIEVRIKESSVFNQNLPRLKDAVISMILPNETKTDTLHTIEDRLVFSNIPHHFLGKKAEVRVNCRDFIPLDACIVMSQKIEIDIFRDPHVYGDIYFTLWDLKKGEAVPGVKLRIAGQTAVSDTNGVVSMFIPLEQQSTVYNITASIPLVNETVHPSRGDDYIIPIK